MAEITKVTTPMIPRENLGSKNKPVSDQAFELTDPNKVHKPGQGQDGKILDNQDGQAALRESMSQSVLAPLMRPTTEMLHAFQKITMLLQMGISTSEIANDPEVQKLMESLYLQPEQLAGALREQDAAAVLFKGSAFDLLRDIMAKFDDNPRVKGAVSTLLKTFEQNVNTENSIKTILHTCTNLLDYLFSNDRAQFAQYLEGLSEMLLPGQGAEAEAAAADGQAATDGGEAAATPADKAAAGQGESAVTGSAEKAPAGEAAKANLTDKAPGQPADEAARTEKAPGQQAQPTLGLDHKEAAQILKSNLLPLLGEIVVKYNQNDKIRDMVMVVVHNIVRVDQGSPEGLREAIAKLVNELRALANLPPNFEKNLTEALQRSAEQVKLQSNETMEKLTSIISETLSSVSANPAMVRQAESMLMSMLQNQSAVMELLHFILPMETPGGKLFAEMYVDPDSDEKVGRSQGRSRKIFLAFESESIGAFELSFVESAERVDFAVWCPEMLVPGIGAMKRRIGDLMQIHGYTMNSFQVAQLREPQNVAQVFPRLLNRRTGVDVRI